MADLWEVDAPPPISFASDDDSEEEDIDPERYLPDAKRRKLMKRRGGRNLAAPEALQDISDDDGVVAIDLAVEVVAAKPAAKEDSFAKLLESPELVKPPRGLGRGAAPANNENLRLVQQLRQGLADLQRNCKDLEEEEVTEMSTAPDPTPKSSRGPAVEPATAEPSHQADEAPKLSVWIQDAHGLKRRFKLRRSDPFSKLMKAVHSNLVKDGRIQEADKISFIWEDDDLQPQQTPEETGWDDEEVVDIKW